MLLKSVREREGVLAALLAAVETAELAREPFGHGLLAAPLPAEVLARAAAVVPHGALFEPAARPRAPREATGVRPHRFRLAGPDLATLPPDEAAFWENLLAVLADARLWGALAARLPRRREEAAPTGGGKVRAAALWRPAAGPFLAVDAAAGAGEGALALVLALPRPGAGGSALEVRLAAPRRGIAGLAGPRRGPAFPLSPGEALALALPPAPDGFAAAVLSASDPRAAPTVLAVEWRAAAPADPLRTP